MFFSLLKQKAATERPFEVKGDPSVWEGGGTVKKNCLARPSKKICPKCMLLGTFDVIWDDLRTFWSDFCDFRMQNYSVL